MHRHTHVHTCPLPTNTSPYTHTQTDTMQMLQTAKFLWWQPLAQAVSWSFQPPHFSQNRCPCPPCRVPSVPWRGGEWASMCNSDAITAPPDSQGIILGFSQGHRCSSARGGALTPKSQVPCWDQGVSPWSAPVQKWLPQKQRTDLAPPQGQHSFSCQRSGAGGS